MLGTPAAGLKSPQLPPLSPPPVDAEVTALEAEVEAASNRVAQLRIAMQAQVQEQLAAKLTNCLPTADWSPPKPPTGDASHAAGPAPEELRSRLAEAAHKMPELRARLEDAHSRLERVLDVAAAEGDRPPPNTVERAVLGIEDGEEGGDAVAQGDATGEVPTAVKKALQSGRVSMRSRGEVKPLELEGDGGEERAGEAMDE